MRRVKLFEATETEGAGSRQALRPAWRWLPVLAWMGLVFYVSSRSQLPSSHGALGDAVSYGGHFAEYAVLGGLLRWALGGRVSLLALAVAVFYGLSDEFHQSFVPGRDASVFDFLADVSGSAFGVAVLARLVGALTRPHRLPIRRP